MLIDARDFAPGARLRADVVVVGAGPLGIALALELGASGLDVIQLESGGLEREAGIDDLGEPATIRFGGVRSLGNTRQIGGNANAWQVRTGATNRGVRLLPLNAVDLEGRPGDPGSVWPLGIAELEPYLARAQRFFALPEGPRVYEASQWAPLGSDQLLEDPDLRTGVFLFADGGALIRRLRREVTSTTRIRLVHHATALEILTTPDAGRATGVRAASAPGRHLSVEARFVVLAAGAITSTQLLLASNAVRPEGLGNRRDLVGRYFMDHLLIQGGELWPATSADFARRTFYDLRDVNGVPILGHLQLSDEAVRREGLLNLSLLLYPRDARAEPRFTPRQRRGQRAALAVREAAIRNQVPKPTDIGRMMVGIDGVLRKAVAGARGPHANLGRGGWSMSPRLNEYVSFEVVHQAEQAPHQDNRITLSDRTDRLGLRRVDVRNVLHDEDAEAIRRAQEVFARGLARNGWGEFRIADLDGRPVVRSSSSNHFMGTTRMNASPQRGVVDAVGQVHGTSGLYVASSSVFPTGGFGNVTLTALALAFRTADALLADARTAPVVPTTRSGPDPDPSPDALKDPTPS